MRKQPSTRVYPTHLSEAVVHVHVQVEKVNTTLGMLHRPKKTPMLDQQQG